MNQSPERQKILDRIAKCLKLSKSPEPHEAASALRHAQALMAKFSVSEKEVLGINVSDSVGGFKERRAKTVPVHYNYLVSIIGKAMGVRPVFEDRHTGKHVRLAVRYFGTEGRPDMAVFAHDVVLKAMHKAWLKYLDENPEVKILGEAGLIKNRRMSFYLGWLETVGKEIQAYGFTPEEVKMIEAKKEMHYGELTTAKSRKTRLSGSLNSAGAEAGKSFSLHRPMNNDKNRLGNF